MAISAVIVDDGAWDSTVSSDSIASALLTE
jgi:hypothetical protein